jgi:hypothetical protein
MYGNTKQSTLNNVAKNTNPINIDAFASVDIELKKLQMERNKRDLFKI